jgi:hypothetical protein
MMPVEEMGLRPAHRDAHRRHAVPCAPAPAEDPARRAADDAGTAGPVHSRPTMRRNSFADLKCVIVDEIHAIAASKRGDLAVPWPCDAGTAGRQPAVSSACPPRCATRRAWPTGWMCAATRRAYVSCRPMAASRRMSIFSFQISAFHGAVIPGALPVPEVYRSHQEGDDDAGLRQHAQPGRADVPGAVERERGWPADRAAPRLPVAGPAHKGRGGHGGRAD